MFGSGQTQERLEPLPELRIGLDRTLSICVGPSTSICAMAKIDPSDLLAVGEVADLSGLARRRAVSIYRARYSDFRVPVMSKNSGLCVLWLGADVEAWAAASRS